MKKLLRKLNSGEEISFFNEEANRQIAQRNWVKQQKHKGQYGYRFTSNLQTVNRNLTEAALKFGYLAKSSSGNYCITEKGKQACHESDKNLLYWEVELILAHPHNNEPLKPLEVNAPTTRWNCILTPMGPEGSIKINDYDLFSLHHINFKSLDDLLRELTNKLSRRGYTKKQIRLRSLSDEMKSVYQEQTRAKKAERLRIAKAEVEDIQKQRAAFNQSHILMTPVTAIGLTKRTEAFLARIKVAVLGDLVALSNAELLKEPNCGHSTIRDIEKALSATDKSLHLGMTIPDWQATEISRLKSLKARLTIEPRS